MAHHLDYLELIWYSSLGLGAFRVVSQFAIKMIAIFAREEFSKRAFEVLKISSIERAANTLRGRADNRRHTGQNEISDTSRHYRRNA
jgi:hypothetical protein